MKGIALTTLNQLRCKGRSGYGVGGDAGGVCRELNGKRGIRYKYISFCTQLKIRN